MSELKEDPRGRKQIIVALGLILTAWIILAFSAKGARLSCEPNSGQCSLHRRTLFKSTSETFRWIEVREVSSEYATTRWTASGGGSRIIVKDNIFLHTDRLIPVLNESDAWLFGSLGEESLRSYIGNQPPDNLWLASFGLQPWFLWFVAAAVGALFLLLSVIRKIEPNMSAAALRSARVHNLTRFLGLTVFLSLFWAASIFAILYFQVFRS
ncbi:MAG: hypothetical protein K1X75_13200 [Leptospirales bacterium]|nr:hypothetical protein [Leptospirales bacterium]